MTESALSFDNLGFAYRAGHWVLRGYQGSVDRGRVFAMLGPNARGKSTLLKLLIGALQPLEGTVRRRGMIAFVLQLFQVSFPYLVLDMVMMGRARHIGLFATPSKRDEGAAMTALDRIGLADLAERPFDELSGGQRQLVIFARALASEADVLVLDEPTSALDLKNQSAILAWIARLSREHGLTVLFTTHHPHHAHAVADQTLLMMGEHDFICGPTDAVMTEENLQALYGVSLKRLCYEFEGRTREAIIPVYPGLAR